MMNDRLPKIDGKSSLYVGNLPKTVRMQALHHIFSSVGSVQNVKICRDVVTRESLGYGYVNFSTPKDAQNAIEKLNYSIVEGKPIRIMYVEKDFNSKKLVISDSNVFVRHLELSISERDLYETFSAFGPIHSVKIARGADNASLGYGYVNFKKKEDALRAIKRVSGMKIGDKNIAVELFKKKQERTTAQKTNVYIKDFPLSWNEEKFKQVVSEFGPWDSIHFPKTVDETSKGFGMVNYDSPESAAKAIETLNCQQNEDGAKIYAGYCETKAKRSKRLRNDYIRKQKLKGGTSVVTQWLGPDADKFGEEDLRSLFSQFGKVLSVKIPIMKISQNNKRFGFVNLDRQSDAQTCIMNLNNKEFLGLNFKVEMQHKNTKSVKQHNPMPMGGNQMPMNLYGPPLQHIGVNHNVGQNWQNLRFPPGYGGNYNQQMQQMQQGGMRMRPQQMEQFPQHIMAQPPMVKQPDMAFKRIGTPEDLIPKDLAKMDDATAKQIIGETLYPMVQQRITKKELAGKITGMLLEMDNTEVLMLFDQEERLREKIEEAVHVIDENCEVLGY